jgi:CRISPR/Cas system endoribonuclease Cas6 (RAMP superfamily)
MKLGGFLGELVLQGKMGDWIPLLSLGEFVHVGKGATFGLGKFRVTG